MKTLRALFFLLAAPALWAADEAPKFNGLLAIGEERRFVLVAPSGRVSDWLRLGESFAGYRIKAYEAKTGALELERESERVRIFLVPEAATLNASPDGAGEGDANARAVLEALRFESMLQGWLGTLRRNQLARIDAWMKPFLRAGMEPEEIGAVKARFAEALGGVLASPEVKDELERAARETFSTDELHRLAFFHNTPEAQKQNETQDEIFSPAERAAIAAFRSSPLGQKLNETQPLLTRKMGALLEPRIEALQPKLQAIVRDVTGAVP